jgi:hypothetical protein
MGPGEYSLLVFITGFLLPFSNVLKFGEFDRMPFRLLDDDLSHAEYLAILKLSEESEREAAWLLEKVRLALRASEIGSAAINGGFASVPRVRADELSVEEFRKRFLLPGLPVVITGLEKDVMKDGVTWNIDYVAKIIGRLIFATFPRSVKN